MLQPGINGDLAIVQGREKGYENSNNEHQICFDHFDAFTIAAGMSRPDSLYYAGMLAAEARGGPTHNWHAQLPSTSSSTLARLLGGTHWQA